MGKEKKEAKREQKEKSNRKKCCMAMTSKCLACKEGVSEKKYCKKNPNTNGCSGKGGDGSNKQKWKQVCDDVKQLQAKHPDATKNDVKKYLKKDHSMSKKEIGKFLNKFCKLKFAPPMCCMAMTSKCLAC